MKRTLKKVTAKKTDEVKPESDAQYKITFTSLEVSKPAMDSDPLTKRTISIREPVHLLVAITEAELSFFERRIYWMVVKEIKSIQRMKTEELKPYSEITFEFHYSNVYNSGHPTELKAILAHMRKRTISWTDETENHNDIVIFPQTAYSTKTGVISLTMYHKVIPLFLDLSKGYTSFQLEYALALSSTYAQIMYPLLSRFRKSGKWHVSLEELRELMGVGKLKYANFAHFRLRVIETALIQINKETDLSVSYEETKTRKTVTGIIFKINTHTSETPLQKEELRQQIQEDLKDILAKDESDLIYLAASILKRQYPSFSAEQRTAILRDREKLHAFIRATTYVEKGFATIDHEAYVAQAVFNYKKKL
jgi:plasmid replication initiation protein